MKKLNLSPKAKKIMAAAGSALVCVGVLALVLTYSTGASQNPAEQDTSSDTSTAVSVTITGIESQAPINDASDGAAFVPSSGASQSTALTTPSKPTTTPPKPTVDGDSKNGQQPTNPALTDKTKQPTYTTKPKATTSSSTKSSSSKSPSSKSSGGSSSSSSNHAGQIYVPGFGWQTPGSGKGTVVDGTGDINKQVGTMD